MSIDDKRQYVTTRRLNLIDFHNDPDTSVTITHKNQEHVLGYRPGADPRTLGDQLAYCFHEWCYIVLEWNMKGLTATTLYKLAKALTPDPSIWQSTPENRHSLAKIIASQIEQPLSLSGLAVELRTQIWGHVGLASPYSAFLIITGETSRLAHKVREASSGVKHVEQEAYLSSTMVSVFGTEYIQTLALSSDCVQKLESTTYDTTVRYARSCDGICAIQLSNPGWKSHWVGKFPNQEYWTGSYLENIRKVSDLQFDFNVSLNILSIAISNQNRAST